jgi:hypothetical protein
MESACHQTRKVQDRTYGSEPLVARPQLGLDARVRPAALQDLVAVVDPSLGGGLAETDLLAFVAAREGIEVDSGKKKSVISRRFLMERSRSVVAEGRRVRV